MLAPREIKLVAVSDEDLVQRTYDIVDSVATVDYELAGELDWVLAEAFERFAPHAEWAAHERYHEADDDDEREFELKAIRDRMDERQAARLLLRGLDLPP